ncbi:Small subunit processome complex component [Coniochaeta pulveracea]|uniref:Small subunit processome complex component n=1 Tax=Coniochaeta pulveracea TaxID=177199 RepID=A0A420XXM9_9PEZI|nr:Small subunit processome complex component [Coniochaeta pulveracea]
MIDPTMPHIFGGMDYQASHATPSVAPIPTVIPPDTPAIEHEYANDLGLTTLWVVFGLMLVSSAVFTALSWNVPISKRLYHVTTTVVTIVGTLSYFAMASGHGVTQKCEHVTDHHHDIVPDLGHTVCRQVYWARYVDWSLTTPLLLLNLCLLAGVDGAHTLMAMAASLIMTLTGLFAALGDEDTAQKWGWFSIACVSYVFVIWHVALHGSTAVRAKGDRVTKLFGGLAAYTLILWTLYPIAWGVTTGAHKTNVNVEIIIFAVLDVLTKAGFGLWLLISHRKTPEVDLVVDGYWSHGLASEGRIRIGDDDGA